MTDTFYQAIQLFDQLRPIEQAKLLAHLSRRLAQHIATQEQRISLASPDSWTRLEAFRREMEALGDAAPNFAAQLDADRAVRLSVPGADHVYS